MKIGIFDSGLGGLCITKAIVRVIPKYDYIYLGDTKRVPYGNRSQKVVFEFLQEAVLYLFKRNCLLVIVACNTASAGALRKIQQEYLPAHYPTRRVLGVIRPTVEVVSANPKIKKVGVLATQGTVNSGAYIRELKKLNNKMSVVQQAAPLLVPLIENGATKWLRPIAQEYLEPLQKENVDAIVLGCTHYPMVKRLIRKLLRASTLVLSQDEVIPHKLKEYLARHPEIEKKLSKRRRREFLVTDLTEGYKHVATEWFGKEVRLKLVKL